MGEHGVEDLVVLGSNPSHGIMDKIKTDDIETYIERTKERRQKLRELILKDDGSIVSIEELEMRLDDKYGIIIKDKDGTKIFTDRKIEKQKSIDSKESITPIMIQEDVPATRAYSMVSRQEHPDELIPIEERAKKQREFDKAISKEFNKQLEDEDPFPLRYKID